MFVRARPCVEPQGPFVDHVHREGGWRGQGRRDPGACARECRAQLRGGPHARAGAWQAGLCLLGIFLVDVIFNSRLQPCMLDCRKRILVCAIHCYMWCMLPYVDHGHANSISCMVQCYMRHVPCVFCCHMCTSFLQVVDCTLIHSRHDPCRSSTQRSHHHVSSSSSAMPLCSKRTDDASHCTTFQSCPPRRIFSHPRPLRLKIPVHCSIQVYHALLTPTTWGELIAGRYRHTRHLLAGRHVVLLRCCGCKYAGASASAAGALHHRCCERAGW